jgi:hypothetical protein
MAELRALASKRFRLPEVSITRSISVLTLERLYYSYRKGGFSVPQARPHSDVPEAARPAETRDLPLASRRDSPSAPVPSILGRWCTTDGRLDRGAVSAATVRRLFD